MPAPEGDTTNVIGTACLNTSYDDLIEQIQGLARSGRPWALDFTNTHIVTMRHEDAVFARHLEAFDFFVADSQVLFFAIRLLGGNMPERVYGPTFMRRAVEGLPHPWKHYFLGGSATCIERLLVRFGAANVVGSHHGYFDDADAIIDEINRLDPDFIWVGLGTPKQQAFIAEHKHRFRRSVLLAVGFAFDVNAGTKNDAPRLMQELGLTWLFRLYEEPKRLFRRYAKYNPLFVAKTALQLTKLRDYENTFGSRRGGDRTDDGV